MHRLQVPLDGAEGEAAHLPQGRNQAEQVQTQPLAAQGHPRRIGLGHSPLPAGGTGPSDRAALGDLDWRHRDVDDLPGPLDPAAAESGAAIGTGLHRMVHLVSGSHALAGKAVGPGLPGTFFPGGLPARLGLVARHPLGAAGLGLALQDLNAPLQLDDECLLLTDGPLLRGNNPDQSLPAGGSQVRFGVHPSYMT